MDLHSGVENWGGGLHCCDMIALTNLFAHLINCIVIIAGRISVNNISNITNIYQYIQYIFAIPNRPLSVWYLVLKVLPLVLLKNAIAKLLRSAFCCLV